MEVELRQIREGNHPTLKAEMRKLEEQRQRQKAEIAEHRDMRLRTAMDEFEREKKAAEDDFKAEEENLRERFLNEFEDKRRRTDEGRYDGNFSQMRAAAIRKMRTRSNVDPSAAASRQDAAKNKREKLTWPSVQFALKPTEVHDDLEEVQRAYNQSVRHAEEAASEEVQPAKKARSAPEQPKPAPARKAGARAKVPDIDLKGKSTAEVVGARITVWYEEASARGRVDVPYPGTVTGHKKDGLTVRFDGSPEDEEELITNDDEWLWGEHKKKPSHTQPAGFAR